MSAANYAETPGEAEPEAIDKLIDAMFPTYPPTPGEEEPVYVPSIRECLLFLAGNDPDRARVVNGAGFNKFDGDYGHKLAHKPVEQWTEWDDFYGYKMLVKYTNTQLVPAGLRFDLIKPPAEPKREPPYKRIVQGERADQVRGEFGSLSPTEYRNVRNDIWSLVGIRWDPGGGNKFLITKDAPSLKPLLKFVIEHEFEIDPDLLHELQDIITTSEAIVKASKGTSLKAIGMEGKWELKPGYNTEWRGPAMPHQEVGVFYIEKSLRQMRTGGLVIGDEMGLGKTWEALLAAHHMFTDQDWERGLLILVPTHLAAQWEDTARGLLPQHTVARIIGGKAQHMGAEIIIVPYSVLRKVMNPETKQLQPNDILMQLSFRDFAGIVCDEGHYLKNDEAMRTTAVKEIFESANPWFRLDLTGTPVVNRPDEESNQLELLGVIKLFGSKFVWEREARRYPIETVQRMRERGVYLRREKTDVLYCQCPDRTKYEKDNFACPVCGGIPIKRREVVLLTLDDEARKRYDYAAEQFRKWLLEEYQGDMQRWMRSLRAELLVRIGKLSHLVAVAKHDPFVEWHRDFLEASDQKVVMFAHHNDVQEKLIVDFPGTSYILGSQYMSDAQKVMQERAFQTNPDIRTMVYTTLGATGRNLTASSNVSFLELEWGPVPHDQAEDRCNRIGSERMLNSRFFLAENTIDQYRMAMIDAKRKITTALNKGEEVDDSDLLANMLLDFMQGKAPSADSLMERVKDTYGQPSPDVDPEDERRQRYDKETGR